MSQHNNTCLFHLSNDDVLLISVENPNLTTPVASNPTGMLSWLKYDLSNQKASNQYLFKTIKNSTLKNCLIYICD